MKKIARLLSFGLCLLMLCIWAGLTLLFGSALMILFDTPFTWSNVLAYCGAVNIIAFLGLHFTAHFYFKPENISQDPTDPRWDDKDFNLHR